MYTHNLTKTNEISFNTDLLVIAHYVYMYCVISSLVHHVRPDDCLIEKGRNMSIFDTLHLNKVLCFDLPTLYQFDI